METATVGRVLVEARIENMQDLWGVANGQIPLEKARSIMIQDALVDTGATMLSLPRELIEQLGLKSFTTKRVRTSQGERQVPIYDAVKLTILGRTCTIDVMEVPTGVPALIGQVPLELLDFVVDVPSHRLVGNPAHGGEHMFELY